MRQNNVKIQNLTKEDFVSTKKLLSDKGIEFYSFTPKDEKPFTLLIKNITEDFDEDEIKAAVEEKVDNVPILDVKKFNSRMWIIQLKDAESSNKVKKLRSILCFGIKVSKFQGSKTLQCRNCQRYNHLASHCNLAYRYVKCGEGHGPKKCKIPSKDENNEKIIIENPDGTKATQVGLKLKCANCEGEHAANYSKCPVRIKMTSEKTNEPKTTPQRKPVTSFRNPSVSFSNVVQSNKKANEFNINNVVQDLFGKDLTNCLSTISNFIPKYNSIANREDKQAAVFNLMFQLCLN